MSKDDIIVRLDILTGEKRLAGSVTVPRTLHVSRGLIGAVELSSIELLASMLDALEDYENGKEGLQDE